MNSYIIFYIVVAIASLVLVGLATPAKSEEVDLVDDICLGCICDAISDCNVTTTCDTNACGLFRITWIYWADMGKLTVNGESPDSPTAFVNCVNDPYCATQSLQRYMRKYKQDCNEDNKIDCYDYASIHMLGGRGCPGHIWGYYSRKLNQCLGAYSVDNDDDYPEEMTTEAIQNSDFKTDAILSEVQQTTETVELEETVTEMEQVAHSNGFAENVDSATENSEQITEDFPEESTDISLENTTKLAPITLLEHVSPKVNTTTAFPILSKLETLIDDQKVISSDTTIDSEDTPISHKFDIVSRYDDETISLFSDLTNDTQLRTGTLEKPQDRFYNKLEQMEKSKNDFMEKHLSFQEKFLEAILNKNRIEEERNEIFKEMAKNMKPLGTDRTNDSQWKRRTIENRWKQKEEAEKDQREKQLKFEEKFLEAFLVRNPIEAERNGIIKEVAKNNKPSSDVAPNYFLL